MEVLSVNQPDNCKITGMCSQEVVVAHNSEVYRICALSCKSEHQNSMCIGVWDGAIKKYAPVCDINIGLPDYEDAMSLDCFDTSIEKAKQFIQDFVNAQEPEAKEAE